MRSTRTGRTKTNTTNNGILTDYGKGKTVIFVTEYLAKRIQRLIFVFFSRNMSVNVDRTSRVSCGETRENVPRVDFA